MLSSIFLSEFQYLHIVFSLAFFDRQMKFFLIMIYTDWFLNITGYIVLLDQFRYIKIHTWLRGLWE